MLCEKYQPTLSRDPAYVTYLDKIGQNYFGVPAPPKQGGFLSKCNIPHNCVIVLSYSPASSLPLPIKHCLFIYYYIIYYLIDLKYYFELSSQLSSCNKIYHNPFLLALLQHQNPTHVTISVSDSNKFKLPNFVLNLKSNFSSSFLQSNKSKLSPSLTVCSMTRCFYFRRNLGCMPFSHLRHLHSYGIKIYH